MMPPGGGAAASTFSRVNCGHPHAYLVEAENLSELAGPVYRALGTAGGTLDVERTDRQLAADERLILVTDGITECRTASGVFGVEGIQRAVGGAEARTAAATATAVLHAVTQCWREPLADDGTVVGMCVT